MRKSTAILAAAAILMCAGCQANAPAESSAGEIYGTSQAVTESTESTTGTSGTAESPAVTAAQTAESAAEPEQSVESAPKAHFDISDKSMIWRGADCYYEFYPDGKGGCTMSFENGTGVGFEYEQNADGSTTFHMGAVDCLVNSVCTSNPDGTLSVEWEDGRQETFVPVSAGGDDFSFFTNEELEYVALAYYGAQTGYYPQFAGVKSNDDGTASIQLYDLVEDHNSTSAWYTIDRVTLAGTDDLTGEAVDMSDFADKREPAVLE